MSLTPKTGPTASPKFLSPRTQSDGWVTDTVLKSRGWTFDLLEKGLVDKLETPSLVSSAFGHIDHVLLSLPWWVFLAEDEVSEAEWPAIVATANAFVSMLTKLPKSTSFTILVHETAYSQGEDIFIPTERLNVWLAGAGAAARTTVVLAPKTMRFTIWAEDAYAAVTDLSDGESFLVEPASFKRADDALIADIVAGKTEVATTQAKLYFQGGNILIGDDFWLIGLDYPKNSLSLGYVVPSSNETPLEACAKAYGRNLDLKRQFLAIGSRMPVPSQQQRSFTQNGDKWTENLYFGNAPGTAQPLFHIDMFITLAGRNPNGQPVVAVGDPRLAATILGC